MARSNVFSNIFKTLFPFSDFLWILQKEEYETSRYLNWLTRFFFKRNFVVSERLVYTVRVKSILGIAMLAWTGSLVFWVFRVNALAALILSGVFWLLTIPLFIAVANLCAMPFFAYAHARARARAKQSVEAHLPMKIIGIVGSYGKTTTKHFVYDLVRHRYRTQMIPGTINTTAGIAAWLSKGLLSGTEVLIVEMDAYHLGEITLSAAMARPDIVVITNVGDQHLERFGSRELLARSLAEAVEGAKLGAQIVGDKATLRLMRPFAENKTLLEVDTSRLVYRGRALATINFSRSNQENLARALAVAELLAIPEAFVEDSVTRLELPERRQKIQNLYGYEGIDDSYNISPSTACAGLEAARDLADSKRKKLLVIAAGIPELGPENRDGNVELGRALARFADHTAVLSTMFAKDIVKGLGNAPYSAYPRLADFLAARDRFPASDWVILIEPSLPDLYY